MFGLGAFEIAIIAFMALVFIGPKKLPELAKSMGKFFREFQDAVHGLSHPEETVSEEKKEVSKSEENTQQETPTVTENEADAVDDHKGN